MSMRPFSRPTAAMSAAETRLVRRQIVRPWAFLLSAPILALAAGLALSPAARAADMTGQLHICNADEITTIPELQSDAANNCINDQTENETPKALMCAPNGKAFCCLQKVDQLGKCVPIVGGRKRTVPLHDPTIPKGAPGANDSAPLEPAPLPDNLNN
jgi:hypothetical protein